MAKNTTIDYTVVVNASQKFYDTKSKDLLNAPVTTDWKSYLDGLGWLENRGIYAKKFGIS